MNDKELAIAIREAIAGDREAMERVLVQYMPLIQSNSIVNGRYEEDCRQYIMARLLTEIPKFK